MIPACQASNRQQVTISDRTFPSRNQGSILITTRSRKLGFAECLELKELQDIAQSLEILSLRSGIGTLLRVSLLLVHMYVSSLMTRILDAGAVKLLLHA